MFCPECGEVIGSGPLDLRRATFAENRGAGAVIGQWLTGLAARIRRDARKRWRAAGRG